MIHSSILPINAWWGANSSRHGRDGRPGKMGCEHVWCVRTTSIQSCLILFLYEFIYLYDVLFISLQFAVPLYIFPVHYQFGHDCHWFSQSNPCKTASKASRVLHLDMNNRKQSPSIKPSSIMRGWSEVSYKGYSALDSTIDQYLQTKQWSDHRHLHQLLAL